MNEEKEYLFDTNAFELAILGHPQIAERIRTSTQRMWLSSVAVEEMLTGRMNTMNRARNANSRLSLPQAHENFAALLMEIRVLPVKVYSPEAEAIYSTFPPSLIRIGSQDCRIAAQAMAHGLVVVTRDLRHFEAIGADCEDWSAG